MSSDFNSDITRARVAELLTEWVALRSHKPESALQERSRELFREIQAIAWLSANPSEALAPSDSSTQLAALPEFAVGVELVFRGGRGDEGVLIEAVAPMWRRFLDELMRDQNAFSLLTPEQMEELVAGAYREEGWLVTLTPRSGDRGRDVIAERSDFGAIRVLDQVKRYSPGHVVSADDVRAMYGVLHLDGRASKAVVTTTSVFAPRVYEEFASVMPSRLDLRDGSQLREWLRRMVK